MRAPWRNIEGWRLEFVFDGWMGVDWILHHPRYVSKCPHKPLSPSRSQTRETRRETHASDEQLLSLAERAVASASC